jgi:transposase
MEENTVLSLFELSNLNNLTIDSDDQLTFIEGSLRAPTSCPRCGSHHLHRQTKGHRLFHLPPLGSKPTRIQVNTQKRYCPGCKHSCWPKVSFAKGRECMSHSFVKYALDLLQFGTIKDVSKHLGVGWDTVKKIHKTFLEREYESIDVSEVEFVSIDEFSIAKRHKYMTTIMDIKSGRILYAVEGRKKDDIASSLKDLKKKHPDLKLLRWT